MSAIDETCTCGATFRFTARSSIYADSEARKAARDWRDGHKHEIPVKPEPVRVHIPLARRRAS